MKSDLIRIFLVLSKKTTSFIYFKLNSFIYVDIEITKYVLKWLLIVKGRFFIFLSMVKGRLDNETLPGPFYNGPTWFFFKATL